MRRRIASLFAAFGLSLAVLVGVQVVNPPQAHASATSCAFFGTTFRGPINNGQFCGSINGSGTRVESVTGNFGSSIPFRDRVCNPSLRLRLYSPSGTLVGVRYGNYAPGCSWGPWNSAPRISVAWDFPAARGGSGWVDLIDSNTTVVASVRMRIG